MTEGVININKPAGMTSADVVAVLRRLYKIKRIGHTGTLDPMATGVLPVCIGRATRLIEYYDCDFKTYECTMQLGLRSDTLDNTGNIYEENSFDKVSEEQIRQCFAEYRGWISQIPPRYSALKINGRRAYDLAREGVDFEIKSREIYVPWNELKSVDLREGSIKFVICCSKGTYIRTVCDFIGDALGCGAVMTELTRTRSGVFDIQASHTLEEIEKLSPDQRGSLVVDIDSTLEKLGIVEIDGRRLPAFANGMTSGGGTYAVTENSSLAADPRYDRAARVRELAGIYRVYSFGCFAGTASIDSEGELKPEKVMTI